MDDQSESSNDEAEVKDAQLINDVKIVSSTELCLACGASLETTGFLDLIKSENETDEEDKNSTEEDKGGGEETKRRRPFIDTVASLFGGEVSDTSRGVQVKDSFCRICKNQVQLLLELKEKLEEVKRDLENGIKSFKEVCQKAEEVFVGREGYATGSFYWEIRRMIFKVDTPNKCTDKKEHPYATRKRLRQCRINKSRKYPPQSIPTDDDLALGTTISIKVEDDDDRLEENCEKDTETIGDGSVQNALNDSLSSNESPLSDYEPQLKDKTRSASFLRKRLVKKTISKLKTSSKEIPKKTGKRRRLHEPEDTDDDDVEASLRGRMFTDPVSGRVLFLNVSFEAIEKGRYRCLTCDKDTSYHRGSLKKHAIVMHTDMFVCQECGQHCPSSKHLTSHIRRVHRGQDRKFIDCLVCGKPCSSKRGRMEKHMVTHMSAQEKEDAVARGETIPQWNKTRRHVCELCGTSYEMRAYLVQHKIREHPSDTYTADDRMACKEMCPDCGKLVHKHYLKKHQELVHSEGTVKRFSCGLCEKRFTKASDLQKHKTVVHEKLKPFSCSLCPKKFALKEQLRYHMDNHQNIRPHQCDNCPMSFARKHHLERHIKIYHEPGANPKRKTYVRGPETKVKPGGGSQKQAKVGQSETFQLSSQDQEEQQGYDQDIPQQDTLVQQEISWISQS